MAECITDHFMSSSSTTGGLPLLHFHVHLHADPAKRRSTGQKVFVLGVKVWKSERNLNLKTNFRKSEEEQELEKTLMEQQCAELFSCFRHQF